MRYALAAALFLTLAWSAPAGRAADTAPVQIDAILSVTGPGAFFGSAAAQTLKIIEDYTNEHGGIDGRPMKFNVLDDGSNPQTTVQITNQLIARKSPATLGPSLTVTCQAMAPLVTRSGPVSYCISPSLQPVPKSYIFSNGPTSEDMETSVIRFFRERGLTRIAVLDATDASGQAIDKALDFAFALPENKNVTAVARQHFNPTDISVSAQMTQIKAAQPQVLISWAVGTPFGTVLRGLNDAGLDIPVCTGAGNMTVTQMTQYAAFLPKHLYFSGLLAMAPGADVPKPIQAAQVRYFQAFKAAGVTPDGGHGGIWDMAMIYVEAFRHYHGTPTADQVHDFIESLHGYAGANGVYDFRDGSQRGVGQLSNLIETWDPAKDGFTPASKPGGYR